MAKKDSSEETTKGLVADKLKEIDGYPMAQNTTVDGITWFKEDSYKGTSYDWLKDVFKKASKKQTMRSKGTPDYVVTLDGSDIIIVIECKGSVDDHSCLDDVEDYVKHGYGGADETEKYAINGALWYASFLKSDYDVISIGISGQTEQTARVSSFVWPKGEEISSIALIEDGYLDNSLVSITQYKSDVNSVLGRMGETEETVRKQLRRYTLNCANFLRQNGIEDNSKAGFVSAIILGLTNHESALYKNTKNAIDHKKSTKAKKMLSDPIGKSAVNQLKSSLYGDGKDIYDESYIRGIWDIDGIPQGKRISLKKFYDTLLAKDELTQAPKGKDKLFPDGDTVLSCCIYSLYENVIEVLDTYTGIDVMGEFYTTFLRFTKGNAKEKGIVLTPKHVTELFCDIAEFYSDRTATCIMVFKAHIPHDKNKATFFGRWQNDGFKVIPHNGRKDTGAWSSIREEWINQLDGTAAIDDTIWLRKKINPNDEALAEAYIETDYNKLDDSVFERTIKKYALYKYMDEKGLLGD